MPVTVEAPMAQASVAFALTLEPVPLGPGHDGNRRHPSRLHLVRLIVEQF
jgi:hypothetical protein